jgi:hypothetical protein
MIHQNISSTQMIIWFLYLCSDILRSVLRQSLQKRGLNLIVGFLVYDIRTKHVYCVVSLPCLILHLQHWIKTVRWVISYIQKDSNFSVHTGDSNLDAEHLPEVIDLIFITDCHARCKWERILGKYGRKAWIGIIWLRIGTNDGLLWTRH